MEETFSIFQNGYLPLFLPEVWGEFFSCSWFLKFRTLWGCYRKNTQKHGVPLKLQTKPHEIHTISHTSSSSLSKLTFMYSNQFMAPAVSALGELYLQYFVFACLQISMSVWPVLSFLWWIQEKLFSVQNFLCCKNGIENTQVRAKTTILFWKDSFAVYKILGWPIL